MDFGVVGFDGLVGSDTNTTSVGLASLASNPETKQKLYGSGFLKQQRSAAAATTEEEDDWRGLKLVKSDHDFQHRNSLLRSNTTLFSDAQQQQQHMLFFSSPKSESFSLERSSLNATTLPCYFRNAGYNSRSLNGASMHGNFTGAKGPFTPLQWMELEHQALIYKYITANAPVPANLLIPIRNALESAGLSSFPAGLLRPNTLEWGSFNLGFNNTDPEPGRCRRTDGKKWRCSRDAVADQKYCERHMNRGRHRSRKPVEGQTGHSVAGTTTSTAPTATKSVTNASSASASVVSGGGTFSSLAIAHHHQLKNLQPGASNIPAATTVNRMFQNKENVGEKMQETTGLSILSNSVVLKSEENPFFLPKHQFQFEESSRAEFGLVNTDSLLNPSSHKSSSTLLSCRNYGDFPQHITDRERETQYSLRHFMDEWPKNQSDRTQLSISIPMASSTDFLSSTSSPNNEKVTLSPLRLSHELDPLQMGLGVGSVLNEQTINRRANWIPITWETSMGGPLGEVLHNTNNNTTAAHSSKNSNSSALNLMTDGWDSSPPVGTSPTGVLQKTTTFGSLSNSSAGSSPRAEGGSLCSDLLGATRLNSSSLPPV